MTQKRSIDRLTSEMEELFADLWYHRARAAAARVPSTSGRLPDARIRRPSTWSPSFPASNPIRSTSRVSDGVLVISGRRQRPHGDGRRYQHIEIDYGVFERRIALGDGFDASSAEAAYEDGLLTIAVPLRQKVAGPVRVRIRGGGAE